MGVVVGGEGGQSQQLGISLVTFHTSLAVSKLGVNSQQASGVPTQLRAGGREGSAIARPAA